jgi:chemotaxis protein MotA
MKSDGATAVGYVMGTVFITSAIAKHYTEMDKLWGFIDIPSVEIVIGGTFSTIFINFSFPEIKNFGNILKQGFYIQELDALAIIRVLIEFAEKARREGLLSLEEDLGQIENPFVKKGIQLVIDGTEGDLVRYILESEVEQLNDRHGLNMKMVNCISTFGPAFGMIGTLIGLVNMLSKLDDPASLGPAMAVALITTFYGAVMSNLFSIPMERNLEAKNDKEVLLYNIAIEGILSIQAGDNPRIVEEKLKAFLPPDIRATFAEEGEEE